MASCEASTEVRTDFSPSSMRLAISTSPSRVRRETDPILRRYIRTGSLDLPYPASSSSFSSSSAAALASGSGGLSGSFIFFASSTTSMSCSPNIDMTSSIWSEETMSEGSASLTSS